MMKIEFINPEETMIAKWVTDSEVVILEPGHSDFDEASLVATPYVPPSEAWLLEQQAGQARDKRTQLLVECDWTQLPDAPVDAAAWATYRQALRDVTEQEGFPTNIIWPTPPG